MNRVIALRPDGSQISNSTNKNDFELQSNEKRQRPKQIQLLEASINSCMTVYARCLEMISAEIADNHPSEVQVYDKGRMPLLLANAQVCQSTASTLRLALEFPGNPPEIKALLSICAQTCEATADFLVKHEPKASAETIEACRSCLMKSLEVLASYEA